MAACMAMLFLLACDSLGDPVSPVDDPAGETLLLEEGEKTMPTEPVEADIYVEKIIGLDPDFIRGVDVSSYIAQIDSGVVYHDFEGNALDEQGFFDLLAASGINYVRLRLWNDPYDAQGRGYGGGNNDIAKTIRMGEWATRAGMRVLVNFHYSDFWADPSKQITPKAWDGMDIEEKATALSAFTTDTLSQILAAGVDVGMVQVGNETNYGFSGETTWNNMAVLYRAGCDAVRQVAAAFDTDILVAVHFSDPHHGDSFVRYGAIMDNFNVDYDVFAASYYPFWHGSLENLQDVLTQIAEGHDKKVLVTETSYAYTFAEGGGHGHSVSEDTAGVSFPYPVSVQGQATAVRDVMATVAGVGAAGLGVIYWEPAWIPIELYNGDAAALKRNQEKWEAFGSGWASSCAADYDPKDAGLHYGGSSWENQALFDYQGFPLPSLNIWKYVYGGATAPLMVEQIIDSEHRINPGEDVRLPETVSVLYNNGAVESATVVWDEAQIDRAVSAGRGEYLIAGQADVGGSSSPARCRLIIDVINYVPDPSFEEGTAAGLWQISDSATAGIRHEPSNARTGEHCLHFWSSGAVDFTAEITLSDLDEGYYNYTVSLQGGDAGDSAEFLIYAEDENGERLVAESGVSGWQNWQSPEISAIYVGADGSLTLGVSVRAAPGAWGSFDDFYLYKSE